MPESRPTQAQRAAVAARAVDCCEYCLSAAKYAVQSFSIEHIVPISKGGDTDLNNLALACQGCNNHKYTKTEAIDPVTGTAVSLYHPRQHQWQDHFVWSDDFLTIQGISPAGRATVAALQLNRAGVQNLRRLLKAVGEHPPKL